MGERNNSPVSSSALLRDPVQVRLSQVWAVDVNNPPPRSSSGWLCGVVRPGVAERLVVVLSKLSSLRVGGSKRC